MIGTFSKLLAPCLTGIVFLGLISCNRSAQAPDAGKQMNTPTTWSDEVEQVLQRRIKLVESLLREPVVLEAIRTANVKHENLTLTEMLRLDRKWREAKGIDDFIRPLITNRCAQRLVEFQEEHEGFPEVFIADARGLNVCQTNKTSDYYQADEAWWVNAYNGGKGKAHYGEIEYDESARSEAIALYVPAMDPKTNKAIGVGKAIVDITSIKREL